MKNVQVSALSDEELKDIVDEDLDIWKFTYLHCGGKMKLEDPRS